MKIIYITIILLFQLSIVAISQPHFVFKNDIKFKQSNSHLIRLLPKSIFNNSDFQIRLWYAIRRWDYDLDKSNLGLLIIQSKNNKIESNNFHFVNIETKIEKGIFITKGHLLKKKVSTSNINLDYQKLIEEGLLTCKSMTIWDRSIEKTAIERGFDKNKGFLNPKHSYGFTIELINKTCKRTINGLILKLFYEHYDKYLYELIPLIKIQKRLFNIADAGMGI